jgi:hypothetical protein
VRGQLFDELYRNHHDAVFRAYLRFAASDRDWAMDRTLQANDWEISDG